MLCITNTLIYAENDYGSVVRCQFDKKSDGF